MTEELTKVCTKCGRELPVSTFGKQKRTADGLFPWCKECQLEYNRLYYKTHRSDDLTRKRKYHRCITNPSCPRVGNKGAQFELFICEICGTEFRRLKSNVDWNYEHQGILPRFCSHECFYESKRKSHKSKYEKEIERIKKET